MACERYGTELDNESGSAFLVGATVGDSIILLVYGERLLRWWLHGSLEISKSLLWAIAAWMLSQALARIPHLLLKGLSIIRFQIVAFCVATMVAFGLEFALSPYLGVAGILWGTTLSVLFISFPAMIWQCFRLVDRPVKLPVDLTGHQDAVAPLIKRFD